MLQITQTPIVLDEFGFTFLDIDSWPKGYQEVITIKQSLLNPDKPYQFYKDGVRQEMTAQQRTDNDIKIDVTSGTDGDGDATWSFRSTQENGGENNPTTFADLLSTTPTTTPNGGQQLMQKQAIQLNFVSKSSIAITFGMLWPGFNAPVDFPNTEVAHQQSNNEEDKVGKQSGACGTCDGRYPKANGRNFLFGATGNIVVSPSPPPSPPPPSPPPSPPPPSPSPPPPSPPPPSPSPPPPSPPPPSPPPPSPPPPAACVCDNGRPDFAPKWGWCPSDGFHHCRVCDSGFYIKSQGTFTVFDLDGNSRTKTRRVCEPEPTCNAGCQYCRFPLLSTSSPSLEHRCWKPQDSQYTQTPGNSVCEGPDHSGGWSFNDVESDSQGQYLRGFQYTSAHAFEREWQLRLCDPVGRRLSEMCRAWPDLWSSCERMPCRRMCTRARRHGC